MENFTSNSYPESGGSLPISREVDFENPPPWEDQSTGNNNYKVKFMCSYGGKIHPRPHDNELAYIGGETKILAVDRSIKFSPLVAKLASLCDADVSFKYQLPGEDLDSLISVTNDDDLDHMMNEYDRLNRASPKPARLRQFLFAVTPANSFGSTEGRSERERFVDALNSGPVQSSAQPSAVLTHGNADFLFGSEKGIAPAPVDVAVPKVQITDPPIRHHDPDSTILDDHGIGSDRIQKHIQDLRGLRIAEEQQQNLNQRQSDDNMAAGYFGDYYVHGTPDKIVSNTFPGSVPGYQISGGFTPSTDQQPVYMVPASSSMYHAPMARQVTAQVGQGQGYYAVQRMSNEVYGDQPVYNGMQPVQQMTTQQQQQQQQQQQYQQQRQNVAMHSEGIRMVQATGGMTDAGYSQVAYDNGGGRHMYYTAQGNLVTPQPQPPSQLPLQQATHQYHQATLNQDGKVIAPPTNIS